MVNKFSCSKVELSESKLHRAFLKIESDLVFKLSSQILLNFKGTSLYTLSSKMANVVELKVGLHCDQCIKKIIKTIKKIEDIETYDLDTSLSKITVTGNVTEEEVVRVLQKIGKHASHWDES